IGRMVRFARLASPPRSVAWTFDGRQIVVGCEDGHVRVVDPRTVRVVEDLPAIDGWVHSLAASPITREVLAAGDDAAIRRISLESEATRP
ncbi:MAG: PQQ-binding-like beta-propeller repeat protein, partial [Pirellulales bacterium]